ncbi:cation transporter [Thaumasiovibrio subtropicus]|uniref:cation transporter n=1 Tax=Thaumasiovibrio subtropicus TaxID=1891207 RepID=UPI000B35D7C6|nr:copper-translocating P-type ATPase [Thaumasiovibrio subtropicus]
MHYQLPLAGLNCQRCVNKVSAALRDRDDVQTFDVSKTQLSVQGGIPQTQLIALIESLGFAVPRKQTQHFTLTGLNCGRCIAKVTALFDNQDDISDLSVTKESLELTTSLTESEIIDKVTTAGFGIQPKDKKASCCASKHPDQSPNSTTVLTTSETPQATPVESAPRSTVVKTDTPAQQYHLLVNNMTCASCVASVERTLTSQPHVANASVSLAEHSATVSTHDVEQVLAALDEAGYPAQIVMSEQERRDTLAQQTQQKQRRHLKDTAIALGLGAPMMLYGMLGGSMMITSTELQIGWGLAGIATLIMLLTAGRDFFLNAWIALKHKRATMDSLVALGTGAAWLYSMIVVIVPLAFPEQARHVYFEASAMIIGLISLGHAIETRAKRRSSQALEKLIDLQPPEAIVLDNGVERPTPLDEIQSGMLVRLKPGEIVALDGIVTEGDSYLDESLLTGEPMPVNKQSGDQVHAGTQNQQGSLIYRVTATGQATMLAKIIDMVRLAQNSKPALARLVDKIAAVFVPIVIAIALLTALIWGLIGPDPKISYMLVTATTVLIIACPCALGLATPMSLNIGVGRAAELGILVRDAAALQLMTDTDTLVLDKTGTITQGQPALTHFDVSPTSPFDKHALLSGIASIEALSEHPLAKPMSQASPSRQPVSHFTAHPGLGVSGIIEGQCWHIGNQQLMTRHEVDTMAFAETFTQFANEGATPVFVAIDNQLVAMVGISDPLRDDSAEAIKRFKAMGKQVVMLTGDNAHTAKAIAEQTGIDEVIAGVMPEQKAAVINDLVKQGRKVIMVGDGINDAPALAAANVSIAMGSGSDIAKESAHFILMRHSLLAAADTIEIAKATLKNMHQNLFGAFIYNTIGIPVAAGILYPITGTLLNPMIAGAAMALSSITVVSNANRLRLFSTSKS